MIIRTFSPAIDTDRRDAAIAFPRLIHVETRKFFDTLVGQVLIVVTLVLGVGVMVGQAWFGAPELQSVLTMSGVILSLLLPAMGILAVTSEWSHGTASRTFALEPRRARVVLAKLFPPVIATALACAVLIVASVPVTWLAAIARGVPADLTLDLAATAGWFAVNVILVLSGVALGTLTLNAPTAIILVAVSTILWSLIAISGETGAAIASWLDLASTTAPLLKGVLTSDDLARIAVAAAAGVLLPLALGTVRVLRREVR